MYYSLFEIFSVGVGPSSSHTVGPNRAAKRWLENIKEKGLFDQVQEVDVTLYGSLALTGAGHGTVKAIVYGLMGFNPEDVDPYKPYVNAVSRDGLLHFDQQKIIPFRLQRNTLD